MKAKRFFSILLVVALLFSLCPAVYAAMPESGSLGDNITFELDSNGVLTISGSGDMPATSLPWRQYANSGDPITSVVIESGVTSITSGAFNNCANLTTVTIPDSVTSMGSGVFCYSGALRDIIVDANNPAYCSVEGVLFDKNMDTLIFYPAGKENTVYTIPGGVTSIGERAFFSCPFLTTVAIPDSVTSIGESAFLACTALTSINIPSGVTTISPFTFYNCYALSTVTIPDGVTIIDDDAFCGCKSLASITIPDSVVTISNFAFKDTALISITIPASVTTIQSDVFSGCTALETVTFDGNAPTIGPDTFKSVTATCYYPAYNETWTEDILTDYGASALTWEPYEEPYSFSFAPTSTTISKEQTATIALVLDTDISVLAGEMTVSAKDGSGRELVVDAIALNRIDGCTSLSKGSKIVFGTLGTIPAGTKIADISFATNSDTTTSTYTVTLVETDFYTGDAEADGNDKPIEFTVKPGTITVTEKPVTVTWKNENGDVLKTDENVPYGTTPTYGGATPTKESTAQYSYTFKGWDPTVGPVYEDTIYTATFTETLRTYTVTWKNADGTPLETDKNVPYGTTPTYGGATPTKESTAEYNYTFKGWSPEIDEVTGDAVYVATFTPTTRSYTITWTDDSGNTIDTTTVEYGQTPTHEDPTKDRDVGYIYTFAKWDPTITAVTGPATYQAMFTKTARTYAVSLAGIPDGAIVVIKDGENVVTPDKGAYNLTYTKTYTYSIKAVGYEELKGSVIIFDNGNGLEFNSSTGTAVLTISEMKKFTGDLNGDGGIAATDAQALYNYILGKYKLDEDGLAYDGEQVVFNLNVADINGDGEVNAGDILPMLRLINKANKPS